MTAAIFSEILVELRIAVEDSRHSFRYPVLATAIKNVPKQRTIVLRAIDSDLTIRFYTDHRSHKVAQIYQNNHANILFYDPKKRIQLVMEGTISIKKEGVDISKTWNTITGNSKNDYTTITPPGSEIASPDHVVYEHSTPNFAILEFSPIQIEYLQLTRNKHIKIQFSKEHTQWKGTFLTP